MVAHWFVAAPAARSRVGRHARAVRRDGWVIGQAISRFIGRSKAVRPRDGDGMGGEPRDDGAVLQQLAELREQVTLQQQIIESHHALLSTLLLSEEAHPTGTLKLLQDLCLELMSFVHQVCQRHGIGYWLDCGSLLGAIRHGGFIPWDDDLDIAMTRPAYRRFLVALDEEIERLELGESVLPTRLRCGADSARVISGHLQIKCGTAGAMPGMVDVFPYDFVAEASAPRFNARSYRRAVRPYRTGLASPTAAHTFVPHTENGGNMCVIGGDIEVPRAINHVKLGGQEILEALGASARRVP